MSVKLELIQNGRVLPSYQHDGKHFVEAPPEGEYTIRLTNNTFAQKLCVLSVDGVNVVDGKPAGFSGPGYLIGGLRTINIPGWRRTSSEVAAFQFKPQGKSYTAQMGNGTSNTGVVGLAVFDEKEKPAPIHIHHWPTYPQNTYLPPGTYTCNTTIRSEMSRNLDLEREGGYNEIHEGPIYAMSACAAAAAAPSEDTFCSTTVENSAGPTLQDRLRSHVASKGVSSQNTLSASQAPTKSSSRAKKSAPAAASILRGVEDLGTGYGAVKAMHTVESTFERASTEPSFVVTVQYAMRERLIEWGVPVSKPSKSPDAFPAARRISVPAPAGWQG